MFFWTIFKFILGIILIAIVVYLLFLGPGKELLKGIGLIATLPKEAEEASKNSFDVALENLEKCIALKENDCLCEVFPFWPATFSKNYQLLFIISNKKTEIFLIYEGKNHKNGTINFKIFSKIIETGQEIAGLKKTIEWKTEPPLFIQEGVSSKGGIFGIGKKTYYVVSNSLYKKQDILYLMISNNPTAKINIKSCS